MRNLKKIVGSDLLDQPEHLIKKGNSECIRASFLLSFLERDPAGEHFIDTFALAIYGLVIFPKIVGHVDVRVIELFSRVSQHVNPIPTILGETIGSLSFYRQKGTGRFTRCVGLLYIWIMWNTQGGRRSALRFSHIRPISKFNEKPPQKNKVNNNGFRLS